MCSLIRVVLLDMFLNTFLKDCLGIMNTVTSVFKRWMIQKAACAEKPLYLQQGEVDAVPGQLSRHSCDSDSS